MTTEDIQPIIQSRTQAPAIYRVRIGSFEITVLSDGYLDADPNLFSAGGDVLAQLTDEAFLSRTPFRLGTVAYVVNTGRRLILIDAGCGPLFGPTSGFLLANMRTAGIAPEQISSVLITHMHADHVGGLLTEGQATFPNAEIVIHSAELDYYMSDLALSRATERTRPWILRARRVPEHYPGIRFFDRDGEVSPGISACVLAGHTPGHTGYIIDSDNNQLFVSGDIVYSPVYSFKYLDYDFPFSVDHVAAEQSRRRALDMIAAERWLMTGSHLPFPALGHVRKMGSAYEYVPDEWRFEV